MAEKKEKEQKKVRRSSFGRYAYNYTMMPIRRAILFGIFKVIGLIICVALAFFLLSGGINQVQTGRTMANWAMDVGADISVFLEDLFTGGGKGLKITEDGIYFADADVPDGGALDGVETGDTVDQWVGEHIKGDGSDDGLDEVNQPDGTEDTGG